MPKCTTEYSAPAFPDRATLYEDTSNEDSNVPVFTIKVSGVPGEIICTGGDETYRGIQLEAHIDYVFRTTYRAGVKADMRLIVDGGVFADRVLNIKNVKIIRKGAALPLMELFCTELEP